jgi:methenyltetrahydromethanopterin cyclohydrolase
MLLGFSLLATLNEMAWNLCDRLEADAPSLRVLVSKSAAGTRLIDCGVHARGGLEAGRRLAEICLAGLGQVTIGVADPEIFRGPAVTVRTDQPVAACMAAQYAGWQIAAEGYFAMGSGPMRAAAGKEPLFDRIGHRERPMMAVGVLETTEFPADALQCDLARRAGVEPDRLTLLAAPTASLAGTVQVVARSVETALHKLDELGFDLSRVVSGWGTAPLPPVAHDQLTALGRTNDAILYGGEVTLWVDATDAELATLGPRVPSSASADHGQPFAKIFARYEHDFYRIDPQLFSPAVIRFVNLTTGRTCQFGHTLPRVLHESFEA